MSSDAAMEDSHVYVKPRPKGELMADLGLVQQVTWWTANKPLSNVCELLVEAKLDYGATCAAKKAWTKNQSPDKRCDVEGCSDPKHAPPHCSSQQAADLDALKRHLFGQLHNLVNEANRQKRLEKSKRKFAEDTVGTTDAETQRPPAPPGNQDGTTDAETRRPPSTSAPDKPTTGKKRKLLCNRCRNYHNGECRMPDCEKCGQPHWSHRPCPPARGSASMTDKLAVMLQEATLDGARELQRVINQVGKDSGDTAKRNPGLAETVWQRLILPLNHRCD